MALAKDLKTLAEYAAQAPRYDGPVTTNFWLGTVIEVHILGTYAVVEYDSKRPANADKHWKSERLFAGFFKSDAPSGRVRDANGWQSVSQSWQSLEAAIVGTIAFKALGPNTQAGHLFMKMIAPEEQ